MIILNDKEHYNYLIENGFEKNINSKDLVFLARMYYNEDKDEKSMLNKMIEFCNKWCKDFNYSKYENKFYEIIKLVKEKELISNDKKITLYKSELEKIKVVEDYDIQKLMFIMLCIAKKFNQKYIYLNSSSSIKLKDIFVLAKIDTPQKNQESFLNKMYNMGLINVDLKPLLRCNLLYIDDSNEDCGEVAMSFVPNEEMLLEYGQYFGAKTTNCQICNKTIYKTNNKIKYCKECARKMKIKMTIQSQK